MPDDPNLDQAEAATGEATPQGDQEIGRLLDEVEKEQAGKSAEQTKTAETVPDLDKVLEAIDFTKPETIPEKYRSKFSGHLMEADYRRKTQALAEERRQLAEQQGKMLELLAARLSDKGVEPTGELKRKISEQMRDGNYEAVGDLINEAVNTAMAPVARDVALKNAIDTSYRETPLAKEYEAEIEEQIRQTPGVKELAAVGNYRYLPLVVRGLAMFIHAQKLEAQVNALKSDREAYGKRVIAEYLKRGKTLPTTTSRAGAGAPSTTEPGELSLKEAMEAAAEESGLNEAFRH
jgi:hypothetical protein